MKVKGQMNMKKDEPAWKIAYENSKEEMKNWMERFAESYEKNPEELLELLRFGSQFYQYSVKNTTLIFLQNPNTTYVQSFAAWKEIGVKIRKGQKGLKVYVPKQVTYLCTDPPVQLKDATKEQKAAYKEGMIPGKKVLHFGIGNVFDISQTDFPKEQYPKMFNMGEESKTHQEWFQIMKEFVEQELDCVVSRQDVQSIALRGLYNTISQEITLNHLLNDTEKLSTLTHEVGHRITVKTGMTESEAELAADMVSMMMTYRFDLEPTESRKRHFVEHYRRVDPGRIESVLDQVFETYRIAREKLQVYEETQKDQKVRKEQDYERTVKTSI